MIVRQDAAAVQIQRTSVSSTLPGQSSHAETDSARVGGRMFAYVLLIHLDLRSMIQNLAARSILSVDVGLQTAPAFR